MGAEDVSQFTNERAAARLSRLSGRITLLANVLVVGSLMTMFTLLVSLYLSLR